MGLCAGPVAVAVGWLPRGLLQHPLQDAFSHCHALQCGFCTPAMVLAAFELIERNASPSREEIEEALSGQLCRCTGYEPIVDAVLLATGQASATAISS